jgi:DNA-binding transcriptional LysR family regulator
MIDWTDLRYFAAVSRSGSLAGAARALGVNHSTVFRRINSLEGTLAVKLFERTRTGYVLTPEGEEMMATALGVEDAIATLDRRLTGKDYRLSGSVRVTTPDTIGAGFLEPHLRAFRQAYPGIQIELAISNAFFSLSKREADIAIRPTRRPPEELVGRRLSNIAWAVFAGSRYLEETRKPRRYEDLRKHDHVAGDDSLAHLEGSRWLREQVPESRIVFRSNSVAALCAAARAGIGLALLPCFVADPHPDLVRVLGPVDALESELWLLTHGDLRHTARIRAFMDFIAESIAGDRHLLEGRRPGAAVEGGDK